MIAIDKSIFQKFLVDCNKQDVTFMLPYQLPCFSLNHQVTSTRVTLVFSCLFIDWLHRIALYLTLKNNADIPPLPDVFGNSLK